jgi:ribosomal protein S19E (S16A)
MTTEKAKIGISDISSSEGRLSRYTQLCHSIKSQKGLTREKLQSLVEKEIGSPFQNRTVTQRHLIILEKIGLIENMEGIYVLASKGKALCELTHEHKVIMQLAFEEQVVYFEAMFTSILKSQLKEFLEVVGQHAKMRRKDAISLYFSTKLAQNLWNKTTIEKNLIRLHNSGKIPTFFENKFRCMEMWLEDIGLVKKEKDKIMFNPGAKLLLNEISQESNIKDRIYKLAGKILVDQITMFNYSEHKEEFLRIFKEAYLLFKSGSDISDIKAIMTFVCVSLLKDKIRMEEEQFNSTVKLLWSEGLVRSVMLGRDGQPAHVVLSESI